MCSRLSQEKLQRLEDGEAPPETKAKNISFKNVYGDGHRLKCGGFLGVRGVRPPPDPRGRGSRKVCVPTVLELHQSRSPSEAEQQELCCKGSLAIHHTNWARSPVSAGLKQTNGLNATEGGLVAVHWGR